MGRWAVQLWRGLCRAMALLVCVGLVTVLASHATAQPAGTPEAEPRPGEWGTTVVPPGQGPERRVPRKAPEAAVPTAVPGPTKAVPPTIRATSIVLVQ